MNCKNCGAPLEDGQTVCGVCGAQNEAGIPAAEEPVTAPPAEENPTPAEETPVPAVEIPAPAEDNPAPAAEVIPAMTIPVSAVEPIPKKKGKGGLIAALVIFYKTLPPINLKSRGFWSYLFVVTVIFASPSFFAVIAPVFASTLTISLSLVVYVNDALDPLSVVALSVRVFPSPIEISFSSNVTFCGGAVTVTVQLPPFPLYVHALNVAVPAFFAVTTPSSDTSITLLSGL